MTRSGVRPPSGAFLWRFFFALAAFIVIGVVLPLLLVIPEQRSVLSEQARSSAITTTEMAGQVLAHALGSGKATDVKDAIAALERAYPQFGSMSVTNRSGRVVAHTDPTQEGKLEVDLFPPPVSTIVRTSRGRDATPLLELTVPLAVGDDVRGSMQTEVRLEGATGSWTGLPYLGALTACLLGLGFLVSLHLARTQSTRPMVVRERVVTERVEEKPAPAPAPASAAAPAPAPVNELLANVIDATPSAVLVVDEVTRKIMHANGAFCRLWGLEDLENVIRGGDADYDAVATRCNAAADQPLLPSPLGTTELDPLRLVDEEIRCRDGRVVHCFSRPLAYAGRHVRLYVCRDVSAERRREDELTSAVTATSTALANKATFLAQISRTLRAPLDGLISTVGLLCGTALTPQQDTYLDTVRGSAEDVRGMVDNILDLCAIDAGELQVSLGDLDLAQAVHESVEPLALKAHRKSIELIWTVADGVPRRVCTDGDRLRQVLRSLVHSAVHATDHGEIVVSVSAGPADVTVSSAALHIATDGSRTRAQAGRPTSTRVNLRFEVHDSGRGISAGEQAALDRVLSGETTDTQYRTYLPLLVAKRLVDLMGGHIGIESEPSRGSTLWFTLPIQADPKAAVQTLTPNDVLSASRVLIVDDNATARSVLEQQIRGWHITADSAADGADALRRLRAGADQGAPYSLAIIDAHMPEMDGSALVDAIRRDAKLADLPIFLLTSAPPDGTAPDPDITAVVRKPVHPTVLYDALLTHVAAKNPRRTVATHAAAVRKARPRGHLLLAEDNLVNQKIALRMLDKLGYQTDVVGNGSEAVEAAQRTHYDAILMDCQMPEMDGVTAAALIRKHESKDRHVPMIAVTANTADSDRERCLAAGMDDFLAKPVKPADLETMLRRWVSAAPEGNGEPGFSDRLRLAPRVARTA